MEKGPNASRQIEPWGGGRKEDWRETAQRAKLDIAREHVALQDKILAVHLSHNLLNLVRLKS
jgi:hypothetical protein